MYRGDTPRGKLADMSQDFVTGLITHNVYDLQLHEVKIEAIERDVPLKTSVDMKINTYIHGKLSKTDTLVKQNWTVGCDEPFQLNPDSIVFHLSDAVTSKLSLSINGSKKFVGLLCCIPTIHIAKTAGDGYIMNPSNLDKSGDIIVLHPDVRIQDDSCVSSSCKVQLSFKMRMKSLKEPRNTIYGIMPGTFYETIMPETVETMWGPVPLKKLPENQENKCHAVTHR